MMTVVCKSYAAHHDANGITLEIAEPTPAGVLPRLIKRDDAAQQLAVSLRHFDSLCKEHSIQPVDGLPVRYREADLLKLTKSAPATLTILPLPKPASATAITEPNCAAVHEPSLQTTTTETVAEQPKPRTRLTL